MTNESPCTRPVMRYYGGKFRIAAEIVALMPEHDIYVEPFGGAASVLLAKKPAHCEIYNDVCGDVVNVFLQLRDNAETLLRGLFLTPYAREEYAMAYEPTTDRVEAARRFIFRSCAGMGSDSSRRVNGFRTTLDDGKYAHANSWATLPEALRLVCERLRGVIIEQQDAGKILSRFDSPATLSYVDPPYIGGTRKQSARAYSHEMIGLDAHGALLDQLLRMKGKVIVSGYDHELYRTKLAGWNVASFDARDQRNGPRKELVWMNFEREAMLL